MILHRIPWSALLKVFSLVALLLLVVAFFLLPAMASTKTLLALDFEVFGRVQGVFFRKFTQQQASALGLRGWVKNTMTKSVVGQIEGDGAKVEQMKVWLKETGSPKSRIDKVAFSNQREIDRYSFQTFEIRR